LGFREAVGTFPPPARDIWFYGTVGECFFLVLVVLDFEVDRLCLQTLFPLALTFTPNAPSSAQVVYGVRLDLFTVGTQSRFFFLLSSLDQGLVTDLLPELRVFGPPRPRVDPQIDVIELSPVFNVFLRTFFFLLLAQTHAPRSVSFTFPRRSLPSVLWVD